MLSEEWAVGTIGANSSVQLRAQHTHTTHVHLCQSAATRVAPSLKPMAPLMDNRAVGLEPSGLTHRHTDKQTHRHTGRQGEKTKDRQTRQTKGGERHQTASACSSRSEAACGSAWRKQEKTTIRSWRRRRNINHVLPLKKL